MQAKNKAKPSEQIALRVPIDLAQTLDRFCHDRGTRRSAVIVAALRVHLKTPAPAETPMENNTPFKRARDEDIES